MHTHHKSTDIENRKNVTNDHYIEINDAERTSLGTWYAGQQLGYRVGIDDAKTRPNCHVIIRANETFLDAMARSFPDRHGTNATCSIHKMELHPGEYYPRMARPNSQHPFESPGYCPGSTELTNEIAIVRGRLITFMRYLDKIFQTVHPSPSNFEVFGHEVRNLLILASTEVETQWRAILRHNNIQPDRPTTNDYVKLAKPMRLDEYWISLPFYPWLNAVSPFKNWKNSINPTKDLEWYHIYNQTKHDNLLNFSKAKLIHAIESVAAYVVLACAQFGRHVTFGHASDIKYFFQLDATPSWRPSEAYTMLFDFKNSKEIWTPTNYQF